ncbi:MAG: N-formylglutamate amidohydrolase [Thermovirgaceae bacterium]
MKEASSDYETQQYYRNNARTLAQRYTRARGGIELWFAAAFPKGSKILDIGAAAGRDVLFLLEAGYDACGVDPCRELADEGLRTNPVLKDRLACDSLPGLETIGDHSFDGVLCSAVLMHLPEETLFDAAFGLRRVLRPGGRLLVSLPVDAGGEPVRGRDEKGRLFNGLSPERLELMLTRLGFTCIGRGENFDSLGREERKWVVQLFVLETDGSGRDSEIILHIPHSSGKIPPDCRKDILLSDKELEYELLKMTDVYTDEIPKYFRKAMAVIFPVSRLVVDVERFREDADEPMSRKGMGAVYTRTHDGRPLRKPAAINRETLLRRYYDPHHALLTNAVETALGKAGHCRIFDIHSFPSEPLPYEFDQNPDRPDICLGTDHFHTPRELTEKARACFEEAGLAVRENSPFVGTMVPMKHYRIEPAVQSLMIEINRKLIMNEKTGEKTRESETLFQLTVEILSGLEI